MNKLLYFAGILLFMVSCGKEEISLETLLAEMTDREELARYPAPNYSLRQFSSYDRATTAPGDSTWFANWDRSMFIRTDTINGRKEYVMMDAEGPGAVVRFWMTFAGENSGKGTMRIYFDHASEPTFEGTAFDILSGGLLTGPPLSTSVSDSTEYAHRGHNLYLPLPYRKHCKITYESDNIRDPGAKTGGEAAYYNINYRTYDPGTKVITISDEELHSAGEVLAKIQQALSERDRGMEASSLEKLSLGGKIAPGEHISIDLEGEQAIRMLRIRLDAGNLEQALRTTVLEITFDGQRTVWCPAGDFFGTGYQLRYSDTWYSEVDPRGTMSAYWVMPFREGATIALHNLGDQEVSVQEGEIAISPWKWDHRSMYFGTSWHQYTELNTGGNKTAEGGGGMFDINFVRLNGKGVYVGDAITVFNTVYAWWGEGDEKIFVDGEHFPSSIGTGTEDYYGYAWCRPEKFANHPFIAQPDGSGNFWPGYTVNIRYRGLDAIPFSDSIRVDMEMWHWTHATINYAPVTFWYVLPGGASLVPADKEGARAKVVLERSDMISPLATSAGIEAEKMILKSKTGGAFQYQNFLPDLWRDGIQVFWHDGRTGDQLTLAFTSKNEGIYRIEAGFTTAPDYGKFRISFNGNPVPGIFNLYSQEISTKSYDLGMQPLREGENVIRFELVGMSPEVGKGYLGLDYLAFE